METIYKKQSSNPNFYLIDLPRSKYVILDIVIQAGSVFEKKHQNGMAHLLEHYVVAATNSKQKEIKIDGLVGREYIQLWTKFNKKLLEKPEQIFKLIDSILNPDFKNDIFIKEKKRIIQEINSLTDDLDYQIQEFCLKERFRAECSYSRFSLGEQTAVDRISLADLKKFHDSYCLRKNIIIVMGLDQKKYKNEIMTILSHIKYYKLRNAIAKGSSCNGCSGLKIKIMENPYLKSNYLVFSFPGPTLKDYFIKRVALQIFCEILLNNLRNIYKYDFNYRTIETRHVPGMIIFKLRTKNDKTESIIKITKQFLKLAQSQKIRPRQFQMVIKGIEREEKRIMTSLGLRYECILDSIINNSPVFLLKNKEFKKIRPPYIVSVGKKYLNKNYLNLFILGKDLKDINIAEFKARLYTIFENSS